MVLMALCDEYRDTYGQLLAWGKWRGRSKTSGINLVPTKSIFGLIMEMFTGGSLPSLPLSIDELADTDHVVARLVSRNEYAGTAVVCHFVYNLSPIEIGQRLGCGETTARGYLRSGISWIDGAMSSGILIA